MPDAASTDDDARDETGIAGEVLGSGKAVHIAAPNHAHDLEAFDREDGSLHGLKASWWLDDSFQRPLICLDDVVQVLRRAVSCVFGQLTVTLELLDGFRVGGKLIVVIDVGGQFRMVTGALLRKRCAARVFRRSTPIPTARSPMGVAFSL